MAIVFIKEISQENLLFAYNNNIIRFKTDNVLLPVSAELIGLGFEIKLYPHPNGTFYFNFNEYISALINNDNFKDDLTLTAGSFVYDWTNKIYLNTEIEIKIKLSDDIIETTTLNINWLSAYTQIDAIDVLPLETDFFLTPKQTNKPLLKYWVGYPFDISIYTPEILNAKKLVNITNGSYVDVNNIVNRVLISDGLNEINLLNNNSYTTLAFGFNDGSEILTDTWVTLEKIKPNCKNKHYIKWINRYGGWNYWLFSKGKKSISPKGLGEINNDFNNVEDTLSTTLNIGVTSKKSIVVNQDVSEEDLLTLVDLFESPKVYLFTGKINEPNTYMNWLEVGIKEKSVKIEDPKNNFINVQVELEYPRFTRTL